MGLGWSDLGYLIPGYGAYKAGSDLLGSNALTNKNVPTQYQDRSQIMDLINGGMGDKSAGYWSQDVTHQQAPQLQMGADPFRAAQLQQMGQLQGIASGQQMGAGELAAQRAASNALANQQAMARGQRGGNAALAYRNAANQSAAIGSNAAGMGQQAALQDQQMAHGLLGQVGAQGRQADITTAGQNAQLQANTQQQNAQNYQELLGKLLGMNQGQLQGQQAVAMGANQNQSNLLGGLLGGGAQLAGTLMSDERLKTDIAPAGADVDDLLDQLKPYTYSYKDQRHGAGARVGIMAQDMERSALGKLVVSETPDGKALDINKALSAALAGTARLNERVRELERREPGAANLPVARVVIR